MNAAVIECSRCGTFICALCRIDTDGKALCPACFERLSADGSLEGTTMTFRDYGALSSTSAVAGCLIYFIGILTGLLAIYYGIRGLRQKKELGDRDGVAGIWGAITLGVLESLIGGFIVFYLLIEVAK